MYDKSINIEPELPQLVSSIRESRKTKTLGAFLWFPKAGMKHWISFDHLYWKYKNTDIFKLFYNNEKKEFVGNCKVGVINGEAFLDRLGNPPNQNENDNEDNNDKEYCTEKYGGCNGHDDDTIDEAFDGNPELTWNID